MSDDVKVRVGAETEGLEAGMHKASSAVEEAVNSMKNSTGTLGFTIGAVSGVVQELTQQVLGRMADAIKSAVTQFSQLTGEVERFSNATGMGLRDSSIMVDSLQDLGIQSSQYEGIVSRLSRSLRTKEEAFERLGIKIKDSKGELLPMNDIIQNTVRGLEKFKEGTDRNMASQELLRASWKELAPLMRVNEELLKGNAAAADEFGMIVSQNDVEAMYSLKLAMADAMKPMEGVGTTLGRALNPLFVELAGILQGVLTGAFYVVTGAIRGLLTFLEALQNGIFLVTEPIVMLGRIAATTFGAVGDAMGWALQGKFKEAGIAMKMGMSEVSRQFRDSLDGMAEHSKKTWDRIKNMWGFGEGGDKPKVGTENYNPKEKKGPKEKAGPADKGDFDAWRKELQEMKDESDVFRGMELEAERDFWVQKSLLVRAGTEDGRKIKHEIAQLDRKIAQDELKDALLELNLRKDAMGKHKDEVIKIEEARVSLMAAVYGRDSRQYKEALRDKEKAERAFQEEMKKLRETEIDHQKNLQQIGLDRVKEDLNFQQQIGIISNEEKLKALRELYETEHQMSRQHLMDKLALEEEGTLQHQQILNQMELLDQQYFLNVQKMQQDQALETAKRWDEILGTITSAIETSVKGIILGTTTMQKALSNIWNAILGEFISFLAKKLAAWIRTLIMESLFHRTETAARAATETGAALAEVAAVKMKAMGEIAAYAATAGAAATASAAAIPYTGWMIAPAAGAAAFSAAMAYQAAAGGMGFAVGSWQVPQDMVTKVHKGEMIMPQQFADEFREGGSGGPKSPVNINITALDAAGVRKLFKREGASLVDAAQAQARNFRGVTR